jgi:hypothetical protein
MIREDYQRAYLARREAIGEGLRRLGWSFVFHRTDHLASEALVAVHSYLSGMPAVRQERMPAAETGLGELFGLGAGNGGDRDQ